MGNRMIEEVSEGFSDASETKIEKEWKRFTKIKKYSICLSFLMALLFLWGRDYTKFLKWWNIYNGLLGTFGDFIGGVIGTAVTMYSAYLLFVTLKEQNTVNREAKKVNNSVIETNKTVIKTNRILISQSYLQLFDNKFTSFLELYHRALEAYRNKDKHGREAFVDIMGSFCDTAFSNKETYLNRVKAAVKKFEQLYAENCREMSVHLRMLYLLAKLIGNTENADEDGYTMLNKDDRILYAKCLRGQLCDEEMIMLRYNCLSGKGKNMQEFVNMFNLIKHLPLMSLLEFSKWRTKLAGDKTLVNCLNAHFISLKKFMLKSSQMENESTTFLDSRKYKIELDFSDDYKKIKLMVSFKDAVGSPGHGGEILIDKALSKFSIDELKNLYTEFLRETLLVSNFYLFNGTDNTQISSSISKDKKSITCCAVRDYHWILASCQLETP